MIVGMNNKNFLHWNIFMPLSLLGSASSQDSHFRHSIFLVSSMKLNLCYVSIQNNVKGFQLSHVKKIYN